MPVLSLLFFAQVAVAQPSVYTSAAVRDLVARAALANRAPPPDLRGYRASVETEFSVNIRDTLGRERAGQIEQLASRVIWNRDGRYDMRVVGYRSQSVGSPVSTLSFVRGWTAPTLYGDRLQLGVLLGAPPDPKAPTRRPATGWITAVHPFSYDRERYYRFSGGDTVVLLCLFRIVLFRDFHEAVVVSGQWSVVSSQLLVLETHFVIAQKNSSN